MTKKEIEYQIWTDGAYLKDKDKEEFMGIGVTVRDQSHNVVFEMCKHFSVNKEYFPSSNLAEYLAMEEALNFLVSSEYNTAIIRTDSRLVSNQLNNLWNIRSGFYAGKAKEVRALLDSMSSVEVKWTSRNNNIRADELSKMGLKGQTFGCRGNCNEDNVLEKWRIIKK